MPKRKLRIVRTAPDFLAYRERCKSKFTSSDSVETGAMTEIAIAFGAHKCIVLDSSQNALRIVREATENK
jgi:hypothetical protein